MHKLKISDQAKLKIARYLKNAWTLTAKSSQISLTLLTVNHKLCNAGACARYLKNQQQICRRQLKKAAPPPYNALRTAHNCPIGRFGHRARLPQWVGYQIALAALSSANRESGFDLDSQDHPRSENRACVDTLPCCNYTGSYRWHEIGPNHPTKIF